jgi:flagellar hook assembly protein FlgD
VKLVIYNVLGQKVKTLFDGIAQTGPHSVIWNGTDENGVLVAAGMYFYKLEAWNTIERGGGTFIENYYTDVKRMLYLK